MEINARERIIIQNLRRRLGSQKREVNEDEIEDVVFNIILPEIVHQGEMIIGVALINLDGNAVLAETPSPLIDVNKSLELCKVLTQQSCYGFRNIEHSDQVLLGYTENDYDWVVARTSPEAYLITEAIMAHIWSGFYAY